MAQTRQELALELNKMFAILKAEVANETAASFADIKIAIAELILLEPLKAAFDLPNLVSLNAAEQRNFPAIDYADHEARYSMQLTATSDSGKIKATISKFKDHQLNLKFDRLAMILLTDKKKYKSDFVSLTDGLFEFSRENIYDLSDLYTRLVELEDLNILRQTVQGLRANLIGDSILDSIRQKATQTEIFHLNLLPLEIPDTIYTAQLTINKKAIRDLGLKRRFRTDRDYVMGLLAHYRHDFPRDFICHAGLLVSFRPIEEQGLGKLEIIDEGTIEPIDTSSYYQASLDNEIRFRFLLRTCLQQQLYQHSIFWQNEENFFAFGPVGEETKREQPWVGKVRATRTVYEQKEKQSENSRPIHKHFAFKVYFNLLDGNWFLVTEPKWLFSWDRYHKSFAHPKLAAMTARNERNQQIYSHTRFISWFLTTQIESDIQQPKIGKNIVVVAESSDDTNWSAIDETD